MGADLMAGFDLGTTFFKVGLYDRAGQRCGLGRRAFEKQHPGPGRCEVPVAEFRRILKGALDDAIADAGGDLSDIKGVSYAAQANSFLLLDEDHEPLTNIIVWQDVRANPVPRHLQEFWQQSGFLDATGLGAAATELVFAKLDWFRRECPEIWGRCRRIVTLSDYLAWLMTGRRMGDSGTASLLGLWDLRKERWYRQAIELLGLGDEQLPTLYRPGSITVPTTRACSEWLGLSAGALFTIGALDHHTAALGAGIGPLAPVSVSFGTSLVCFRVMDHYAPRAGCCMGPLTEKGAHYQISFCSPGASAMDQYRDQVAPHMAYEELLKSARDVPVGAEGLCADIHDGVLEFRGKNGSHSIGHHVRAIMEMTGRNTANLIDDLGMDEAFRAQPVILAVGGGARSELWMQVVADVSDLSVVQAHPPDTASKGAAMFAAVGGGWFDDLDACASQWCEGVVSEV